ncbi:MAG TPA: peptidoglycan-binding protein [Solirubrobacteraceae bacterium]|nr:peptidoglycan-binding protein [Solirubrobacteraceae bacterium]
MSDPMSGEAESVAGPPIQGAEEASLGGSGERSRIAPPAGRARRRVLAVVGLALVVVVVVLIATDPFAGSGKSTGGVADNATATTLVSVKRQSLSQQTQVSGTLGYGGSSSIRVPSGTAPSAVEQVSQQVTRAEEQLATARTTLASDTQTLAGHQATLQAARAKEQVDCAGDNAAEAAAAGSPSNGESSPGASSPSGSGSGSCSSDVQTVSSAQQNVTSAAARLTGDRSQVSSAEKQVASVRSSLSTARSAAALYGQTSTFTKLPSVGQTIGRGQSLYEISGQPVLLLYGSVASTRAFVAGMSAGSDVAELNANLSALGYGRGLAGDEFSGATEAAIRALQSAHAASVTGELLLGSVVFEPGSVRVTSLTPTVGSNVMPGPVLAITSTARQVKMALDASQQGSVKVGDTVTITLPDNQTTPGRITYVSSVATSPSSSGHAGEEESAPTVEVDAIPTDPAATGHLDQAPVNVEITTESVENVLAVPVDALLALAGGGYAVEVAEGRVHRLVAVTVGLFDDAEGVVQVSGHGLSTGQRVVVPATS